MRMAQRGEPEPDVELPPTWATEPFSDDQSRDACVIRACQERGLDPRWADRVRGDSPIAVDQDVATLVGIAEQHPPPAVPDLRMMTGQRSLSRSAPNADDAFFRDRDNREPGSSHFVV